MPICMLETLRKRDNDTFIDVSILTCLGYMLYLMFCLVLDELSREVVTIKPFLTLT